MRRRLREGVYYRRRPVTRGYGCTELIAFINEVLEINTLFYNMMYTKGNAKLLADEEVYNYIVAIEKIVSMFKQLDIADRLFLDRTSIMYPGYPVFGRQHKVKFVEMIRILTEPDCSQTVATHLQHFFKYLKQKTTDMC